jgi:hypothetical protein
MRTLPADYARCPGGSCVLKENCLRYRTPAIDHHWQTWMAPTPEGCDEFWEIENTEGNDGNINQNG